MKTFRVLYNQNKLHSEITTEASYTDQKNELSLRAVFNGSESYKIGKRTVTVFPGNFLILNEGTSYDRSIYSDSMANTFAIFFPKNFFRTSNMVFPHLTETCLMSQLTAG
jgi:hypothetical protein